MYDVDKLNENENVKAAHEKDKQLKEGKNENMPSLKCVLHAKDYIVRPEMSLDGRTIVLPGSY
jgi:hypothetical protein